MPILDIKDLKKGYADPEGVRSLVVDVPAFSVDAGQQVALRGSSGCGKTTFLNLVAGILQADSGVITIDGEILTGRSESVRDKLRARHMGYVFQTFNLLQGYTALENVLLGMMFGKGADTERAKALLERVGLAERMHYRPRALSVGQQQRVAVARALANHPKLVLADEPTGNLDHHHADTALRLIREICSENGAALLLVSHDPKILDQFDTHFDFADINRRVRESAQ
ncbi:MAG: ATP-binding cassette domain-containing protein [Candidatus Hydrogenedens sp.]|nr:ATP-binding cassette domain-containing protein [Candidatus Hydrogenedens sp.]